ncbi:MAG: DUF2860 family protein [Deltaproteobacteria bacterium]|nr:DUF2860 family protein [Deltaproteobacteria bacterium]
METGFLYLQRADNFSTDSDALIGSLGEEVESESSIVPVVLFNLSSGYGRANAVYFETDTAGGEEFELSLGTVIPLGERENILNISVIYVPFREVWTNPYQTGNSRQETDVTKYGGKVSLGAIAGTPLGLRFKVASVDVEDDEAGELYPSLARDGIIYEVSADYRMGLTRDFSVTPSLTYERADFDGASNSYDGYGASLRLIYRSPPFLLVPIFAYSFDQYDESHPLFGKKREDSRFSMFLTAQISGLFGAPGLYFKVITGYVATDSNIDFCDSDGTFAGMTVGYGF